MKRSEFRFLTRFHRLCALGLLLLAGLGQWCIAIDVIPFEEATNSCSFATCTAPTNISSAGIYVFDPGDEAKKWLSSILLRTGVGEDKFELRIGIVSNAYATVIGSKRYILYNEEWLTSSIKTSAAGEPSWSALGVFAHEIGHHFNNHTFGPTKKISERHRDELEADQWAGFTLANMSASEDEALTATKAFADEVATDTHPPRVARIGAVKDGWRKADRERKREKVTASFASDVISGAAPLKVRFKSNSVGVIRRHSWTFGDGNSAAVIDPDHEYTKPGSYTVSLTVEGSLGQDAQVKPNYIQVLSPLKADFEAVPREGVAPLVVLFKAVPQGSSFTYNWDFGDGEKSEEASPEHRYTKAGKYSVRLTMKDLASQDSESKPNHIIVKTRTEADAVKGQENNPPEAENITVANHFQQTTHPSKGLGIRIGLAGKLTNIKGKEVRIVARFDYFHIYAGRRVPLVAHPQETVYRDGTGRVAIKTPAWKSPKDSLNLEDIVLLPNHALDLFIPYYALNFAPGAGTYTLFTSLEVLVDGKNIYETSFDDAVSWNIVKNY